MKYRLPAVLLLLVFAGGTAMDHHGFRRTAVSPAPQVESKEPIKVSLCKLKGDPLSYNHKLVEVTGFVSHGFEDFTFFDPACSSWPPIWLEYGGKMVSGTMYCCGVTRARSRPEPLVVEGIPVELVDDELFKQFDKMVQRTPSSIVRATIVGRFFSGEKFETPDRTVVGGYGHFGCCSLLGIEQILSVDSQESPDLDYGASVDQPGIDKAGCGYKFLTELSEFEPAIKAQERADLGPEAWAFEDPRRVASEGLAQLLKLSDSSTIQLKETRQAQGRLVYWWKPKGKKGYMVVVSRPYLLSFYAKDPKRVAWVVAAAYETFCGAK